MDPQQTNGRICQGQTGTVRRNPNGHFVPNVTPRHQTNDRGAPNPRLGRGRAQRDAAPNVTDISIGTFNCRTLMGRKDGDSKIQELVRALSKVSMNVLGLCETRREGEKMLDLGINGLLCWSGPAGQRGT